jgi:hypothetical protein
MFAQPASSTRSNKPLRPPLLTVLKKRGQALDHAADAELTGV